MIKKRVNVVEHSMGGRTKILESYDKEFDDELDIRGFLLVMDEYYNLNSILRITVDLEDIGE